MVNCIAKVDCEVLLSKTVFGEIIFAKDFFYLKRKKEEELTGQGQAVPFNKEGHE